MEPNDVNRRDFHKLAAAALAGLAAGAGLGRAADKDKDKDNKDEPKKKDPDKPLLLQEPHVCRGLNSCKGKGAGAKNDCAGQGDCATAKAHTCHKENDCAGLGGCGEHPGENKCKGMGECGVPLGDKAWTTARKSYEAAMKKADKKFGDAPKKKDKDK
jgi:hypothetical protein